MRRRLSAETTRGKLVNGGEVVVIAIIAILAALILLIRSQQWGNDGCRAMW